MSDSARLFALLDLSSGRPDQCLERPVLLELLAIHHRDDVLCHDQPVPGEQRVFQRFSDLTDEAIDTRTWAAIHFRNADVQAANLGREVEDYVHTHQIANVH